MRFLLLPRATQTACQGRFLLDLSPLLGSGMQLDITHVAETIRGDKWYLLMACLVIDMIGALELRFGCGSKIGTLNGNLANGTKA